MKKTNISIFVPHYGCPCRCSFCDQKYISGTGKLPERDEIIKLLDDQSGGLRESGTQAEIAFFGGSFTAIDRDIMTGYLEAAYYAIERYPEIYTGIRCSTRPDCIDRQVLGILKKYRVTAIELGAQSMDDKVLEANDRGHSSDDVRAACSLIHEYRFSLGLQMMTGLYMDTPESCINTAREFISLGAETVRIYPTVILKGTRLGELYKSGEYHSFGEEQTIDLCARLYSMFENAGVRVIRLGLHASRDVESRMLGGVYHPALGERVRSRVFYNEMLEKIKLLGGNRFIIYTDRDNISMISGQKKENKRRLEELGYTFVIRSEEGTRLRVEAARSAE